MYKKLSKFEKLNLIQNLPIQKNRKSTQNKKSVALHSEAVELRSTLLKQKHALAKIKLSKTFYRISYIKIL